MHAPARWPAVQAWLDRIRTLPGWAARSTLVPRGVPIPFGDGAGDPKILDDAPSPAHVSARKEDTFMKDFLKKLLVRQAGQGASATLPELDGMP
jgi:hypothetical protein